MTRLYYLFLAYITLPSGQTMSDIARPAIAHAYDTGTMPALMAGPST